MAKIAMKIAVQKYPKAMKVMKAMKATKTMKKTIDRRKSKNGAAASTRTLQAAATSKVAQRKPASAAYVAPMKAASPDEIEADDADAERTTDYDKQYLKMNVKGMSHVWLSWYDGGGANAFKPLPCNSLNIRFRLKHLVLGISL